MGRRVGVSWLLLLQGAAAQAAAAAANCAPHSDMLGPLYLPGAPFRDGGVVCAPGPASDAVLTVSGRVLSEDCRALAGAVLDIWQCSSAADGQMYYGCAACNGNSTRWLHGAHYCRGKVAADSNGAFTFTTVRPGKYPERPIRHIHVKVVHAETEHVTQLYFQDDPSSASMPDSTRLVVSAAGNSAAVDIATPFKISVPPSDSPSSSSAGVTGTQAPQATPPGRASSSTPPSSAAASHLRRAGRLRHIFLLLLLLAFACLVQAHWANTC